MIKHPTANTTYICLPVVRLIIRDGVYLGWYRLGRRPKRTERASRLEQQMKRHYSPELLAAARCQK